MFILIVPTRDYIAFLFNLITLISESPLSLIPKVLISHDTSIRTILLYSTIPTQLNSNSNNMITENKLLFLFGNSFCP